MQFTCRGRVNPKCQTELVRNSYCFTSYFFLVWEGISHEAGLCGTECCSIA